MQKKIHDRRNDNKNDSAGTNKHINLALIAVLIALAIISLPKTYPYAGAFSNTSPVVCAGNCSGAYERYDFTYEDCDANPEWCFNTIDSCSDGYYTIADVRIGSEYEWVENITVRSLNGSNFTGGDSIEIAVTFDCDYDIDEISFAYTNGSEWRNIYDTECYAADDKFTFYYNFTLDDIRRNHSIRAIIAYDGLPGMLCGDEADATYSDTDDISFFVNSEFEETPPTVTNITPSEGEVFEFIIPRTISISAEVTDDFSLDTVLANITWDDNLKNSIIMLNRSGDMFTGEFEDADMMGEYTLNIIANDSNGNVNSTTTHFYMNKTRNITLYSPTNEMEYPNYTIPLEFLVETNQSIVWAGYRINNGSLNFVNARLREVNNESLSPERYVNNTGLHNISQSFNLTENMTIDRVMIKIKRIGSQLSNITLEIRNDSNNSPGAALMQANITGEISNDTFGWYNFTFENHISLAGNARYWIFITQENTTSENQTSFASNNNTYDNGALLQNSTLDILFIIEDKYHFRTDITVATQENSIGIFANVTGEADLLRSPEIMFYVDRMPPTMASIAYTPSLQKDLDPGVAINVSLEITDPFNISTAILQYRKMGNATWNELPMQNVASDYHADFTPDTEGNWSFRIFANDTLGNQNYTAETIIPVLFERTFEVNRTLFNTSIGLLLNTNASLGKITIKNTGDLNLTFSLNKTISTVPEIYFNGVSGGREIVLLPSSNETVNLTVTSLGIEGQSDITILVLPLTENATPANVTLNSSLVSYVSGPYFLVDIKQYDASTTLGQQRIILEAEVINVGNESGENNTIYWTLPSGWTAKENLTTIIATIGVGEKYTSKITASIPASAQTGNFDITITARNNLTNNSDSRSVTVASTTPQTQNTGGSGATRVVMSKSSIIEIGTPELDIDAPDTIEIVRGETKEILILVSNNETVNISDVTFSIEGYLLSYSSVTPEKTNTLPAGETSEILLSLEAPLYLDTGKYPLEFTAQFIWNKESSIIKKEIMLVVLNTNASEFISCIVSSEEIIKDMALEGYNTVNLESLLDESKEDIDNHDYESARQICEEIIFLSNTARETKDKLLVMDDEKMSDEDSSFSKAALLAKEAFDRGDYALAAERTDEAALILGIEKKSARYRLNAMIDAIINNWKLSLGIIISCSLLSYLLYARISMDYAKRKISQLKREEESIMTLIGKVQTHRFGERAISKRVYEKHMQIYRSRLAKIQEEKNTLRLRLLSAKGLTRKQSIESQLALIAYFKKEIQEEFFVKKIIDRKAYDTMMEGYNNILADMNEKEGLMKIENED